MTITIERETLNYEPLYEFAAKNRVSYNELCVAVRAALAAQPATSADYAMGYAEGFNDACKPADAQPVAWPTPEDIQRATEDAKRFAVLFEDAAPPVPAAVPVAHLYQHCETGRTRIVPVDAVADCDARWDLVGPLYLAAPPVPAAVPLTDEQFDNLVGRIAQIGAGMNEMMRLVRVIERAHGIGDKP